jgi:hypothetical protein
VAAGFQADGVALHLFQKQVLVCRSYFFLVFAFCFFCCCGVGQWVEASDLFGCGRLVFFLLGISNFIPQVVVLFLFSYSWAVTGWRFAFSKNDF